MRQVTSGFLFVLLAASANLAAQRPDPPTPRIEAFVELCETSRRGAIVVAEQRLRALRSNGVNTSRATKQVRQLEDELKVLRDPTQPVVPTIRFPPEVGAIGRLPKLSCHVDQILSGKSMLVRCFFTVKVVTVERFQAKGESVVRPVTFLVRGLPTADVMEGADLELTQVFEITGMASYQTAAGGSQSAMVLTEFDMKSVKPYFRARTRPP
jgi:hypothetical protein